MTLEICGFEHLHLHTDFSTLDGYGMVEEYATRAPLINQKFLTISDHGMLGAIPRQIKACDKMNDKKGKDTLSPIFACELYVNRLQPESNGLGDMQKFMADLNEDEQKECRAGSHLLAIAYNEIGYKNLVRLSSWAWTKGFYRHPRVNYEQLQKYKEGLFFTSCCYNSEVGRAFDQHGEDAAFAMIERYIEMFGKEHYLLEIMLLDFEKQKPYDAFIIKAKEKYGLKLILTNDCLVDGTLIWTHLGFQLIENLNVGDMVLTHNNRYRPIEVKVSRKLNHDERVFEVKATAGTFSFQSTGNHKIYVKQGVDFNWIKTSNLKKGDCLVYPDFSKCSFFSSQDLDYIDLSEFIEDEDLYSEVTYSNRHNLRCGLREKDGYYLSQRGFSGNSTVKIPKLFPVDKEFCRVLGWYIAEGWSDTNSYQVGFALSIHEQDVADFLIAYFSKFGIKVKQYSVSENGIAIRFSSKVFNRVLSKICGKKALNKHLPYISGTWIGKFSESQFKQIIACHQFGDGSYLNGVFAFHSTSKKLIFEIASVLNAMGFPSIPSVDKKKNVNWNQCWHLNYSGDAGKKLSNFLCGVSQDTGNSSLWTYENEHWLIKIQEVNEIVYQGNVHDFQVKEDHSFTANMAVVSNCHYCQAEDSHFQRLMLMVQTGRTLEEIKSAIAQDQMQDFFELQDANLWMKSEEDLNAKWEKDYKDIVPYELFCEAKRTTVEICNKAKGVQLDRSLKLPVIPDADETLKELVMRGFKWRGLPQTREYTDRIKEEYSLITRKGFSSYFLIQMMMTDEARRVCVELLGFGDGSQAVGPGRGSAVGALTCYCLGITNVDPIYEGLLFSRFMSEARGGRSIVLEFRNMDPLPPEDAFAA